MRFFGLGFFMESSPPWALVVTLKRFYVLYISHGVIKKNVMSAQCDTALTPCPRSVTLRWHHQRKYAKIPRSVTLRWHGAHAVSHCADTVPAQCHTALTRCPRSVTLRGHGVPARVAFWCGSGSGAGNKTYRQWQLKVSVHGWICHVHMFCPSDSFANCLPLPRHCRASMRTNSY